MKQVEKNVARIDGITLFGGSARECLAALSARLARGEAVAVYTPNPIMLQTAARDLWLHAALARAELNLPDGIGVVLAARLLGESVKERISGIDMAKGVLALSARRGYRVFLLGGKDGVAREAAAKLAKTLPELCICGTRSGYFSEDGESDVLDEIRRAKPDVLLVCLGSPKQEIFIDRNREQLPSVRLFMALGGTLDVFAGRVRRAPPPVREAGLEWLWRMVLEPRRFRELPKMVTFSCRILKKSCHSAHNRQKNETVLKKL